MARPIKDGVDYFPKDTDFYNDDKVRLIRSEFGAKGMYLLDYILCEIYKKSGYFILWDDSRCFLVSDGAGCGCSPTFVDEFIKGCVRCQFFDKKVFEAYGVITSAAIQRRYIRMVLNRDYISFFEEYFLLDVKSKKDIPEGVLSKCTFKKANLKENPHFLKENSTKESKVKNSILNKREYAREKKAYGQFQNVFLEEEEYASLVEQFAQADEIIEQFSRKLKAKNYKYESHYAAILLWQSEDKRKAKENNPIIERSFDPDDFFQAALQRSYYNN